MELEINCSTEQGSKISDTWLHWVSVFPSSSTSTTMHFELSSSYGLTQNVFHILCCEIVCLRISLDRTPL